MLARIDALLEHGQPRVVFIREAIEELIAKRENARGRGGKSSSLDVSCGGIPAVCGLSGAHRTSNSGLCRRAVIHPISVPQLNELSRAMVSSRYCMSLDAIRKARYRYRQVATERAGPRIVRGGRSSFWPTTMMRRTGRKVETARVWVSWTIDSPSFA